MDIFCNKPLSLNQNTLKIFHFQKKEKESEDENKIKYLINSKFIYQYSSMYILKIV
jgi:hypothetical protein